MIKRLEWKKKPRVFFFPSIFLGEGGGGGGGGVGGWSVIFLGRFID